jgi:hypothetical protein
MRSRPSISLFSTRGPSPDIAQAYREILRLRKQVKQAESSNSARRRAAAAQRESSESRSRSQLIAEQLDPEVVHLSPRPQLRCQPARLLAATMFPTAGADFGISEKPGDKVAVHHSNSGRRLPAAVRLFD